MTHLLLDHDAGEVGAGDEERAAEGVGDAVQGARVVGRQVEEAELQHETQMQHRECLRLVPFVQGSAKWWSPGCVNAASKAG